MSIQLNPFALASHPDPYPHYAHLREHNPMHRCTNGAWVIIRHADVRRVLSDSRFAHWSEADGGPFHRALARWVHLMDPRSGARLRAYVNRIFSPGALEVFRPRIERRALELLQRGPDGGELEFMSAVAEPLTIEVIGALLGVPAGDAERFGALARQLHSKLFSMVSGRASPDSAFKELGLYLHQLAVRAGHSGEPEALLPAMMAARRAGDAIASEDLVSFALIFLFAGHDNMMNFLGNGVLALVRQPDAWERLSIGAMSQRSAVEELLRIAGPVHFVNLIVREPVTLHGHSIQPGDRVLAGLAGANRDPRVFVAPDSVNLARRPNPHLAFGTGALYCVGAALARMQGQAVFGALTRTFALPDVPGRLSWRAVPNLLRGPVRLPLRLRSRAAIQSKRSDANPAAASAGSAATEREL